jgi:K+-sensing histidine kinase KdpD
MDREPSRSTPDETADRRAADVEQRSAYLGFVAHEVRNPLSTALWTAELLARMSSEERGGARGDKLSAMCLRSLARVRTLIEDHFLCERLDAAGIPVRVEAVVLREVVDAVLERRSPDAPPVTAEVDATLSVTVDRTLLERAIDALVAAAGRDNTPVRLVARVRDGEMRIDFRGRAPEAGALDDPRKGSLSDPKGRALALPVARRVAGAVGAKLETTADGFLLVLGAAAGVPRLSPEPSAV